MSLPKIDYVEKGNEKDEAIEAYKNIEKVFGMVPNLLKLVGHSGGASFAVSALLETYFIKLNIDNKIKEIAYSTVAKENQCDYCQGHHGPLGLKAGLTQEQIDALDDSGVAGDLFNKKEQIVIRFALETTRNVAASDEVIKQLKEEFTTKEVVEIGYVVAMANFVQRIGRNFGVTLEQM